MERYDVVVIGAGVCGLQAAFRAVYRDQRVAIVEKDRLGGTCLTRGCIPTKAMVRSAEVAHLARRGKEFGVDTGPVGVNLERIVDRKDEIVDRVEETNERDIEATDGLDLIRGEARFVDEHTLEIDGEEQIGADQLVIATGARPLIPDWPGIEEVDPMTSRDILDRTELPEHLIVVGGGYIGIESAQMYARFGSDVTILQRSTILKEEDRELVEILIDRLEADGVDVREGTSLRRLEQDGSTVRVWAEDGDDERVFEGDALLVAVGRLPNAPSLDPENAGVETYGPGWIEVDAGMRTSQENVWAVGDAIGEYLFTHVGREEVEVCIENMLDGADREMDYHAAPHAVFSDPELARVGMTLEEAREAGYDAQEVSYTYEHVGKALCLGEEEGMMKCIADEETGELLGFHILANHGAEMLPEAVLQMHKRGTVDDISDAIHIHPTLAEAVNDTAYTMAIELGRRQF